MTKEFAIKLIREAARDSANVVIPAPQTAGQWEETVTHMQVIRCLQKGDIVGTPKLDKFGNWECRMSRFSAGAHIFVAIAAINKENRWKLFVQKVEKGQ